MNRIAPLTVSWCLGLLFAASTCFAQKNNITPFDVPGARTTSVRSINDHGVIAGGYTDGNFVGHAFLRDNDGTFTTFDVPNARYTNAASINNGGEVVGSYYSDATFVGHAFLRDNDGTITTFDVPAALAAADGFTEPTCINDHGVVTGFYYRGGISIPGFVRDADGTISTFSMLLLINSCINNEGTVAGANRGVLPVKFTLTENDIPTCTLPAATISVTRTGGGAVGLIDASIYSSAADGGSNFRTTGCQYHYNLAARSLGVGTYRVDISIDGIFVGHAVFELE